VYNLLSQVRLVNILMQRLFEVIDPRGIKIFCATERWELHVLGRHPFMDKYLHHVKLTLASPSFICKDAIRDNRFNYYSKHGNEKYVKVVISESSEYKIGELVTAFLADQGKKNEAMIWPFNNF
jgi:hypothetical protein